MPEPKNPRIELNPMKTRRLDFDSFVMMNMPDPRAKKLRLTFKLIWLTHRTSMTHEGKGFRISHYLQMKERIEKKLSKEQSQEVILPITEKRIEKTLRLMRKAGYMRYVPLDDLWYFSGRASSTLRSLADKIDSYQLYAQDSREMQSLIKEFCQWL